MADPPADLIRAGFTHASVIGILRPEVAYPTRKVKAGEYARATIYRDPCPCPDDHVEVWVRRTEAP